MYKLNSHIAGMLHMRPLPVKRHISALLMVAALVFSLIAPPMAEAYRCVCASGSKSTAVDTSGAAAEISAIPACCCADACAPETPSDISFAGVDIRNTCDTHPVCCCTSDSEPQSAVNQFLLKDDRRPSFTEFQFHKALPSAFIPQTDSFIFRSILAFDRKMTRIPPHLSSTILLL